MQLPIVEFYSADGTVKTTEDVFLGERTVLVMAVGAFNPTCSKMLSAYENAYEDLKEEAITQVLCLSVNDEAVMDAWASSRGVDNVKMLPDGNGSFSSSLNLLVNKQNVGMAGRAWRAVLVINADGDLVCSCVEEGKRGLASTDPYEATTPKKVIEAIRTNEENVKKRQAEEWGEEENAEYSYLDDTLSADQLAAEMEKQGVDHAI